MPWQAPHATSRCPASRYTCRCCARPAVRQVGLTDVCCAYTRREAAAERLLQEPAGKCGLQLHSTRRHRPGAFRARGWSIRKGRGAVPRRCRRGTEVDVYHAGGLQRRGDDARVERGLRRGLRGRRCGRGRHLRGRLRQNRQSSQPLLVQERNTFGDGNRRRRCSSVRDGRRTMHSAVRPTQASSHGVHVVAAMPGGYRSPASRQSSPGTKRIARASCPRASASIADAQACRPCKPAWRTLAIEGKLLWSVYCRCSWTCFVYFRKESRPWVTQGVYMWVARLSAPFKISSSCPCKRLPPACPSQNCEGWLWSALLLSPLQPESKG